MKTKYKKSVAQFFLKINVYGAHCYATGPNQFIVVRAYRLITSSNCTKFSSEPFDDSYGILEMPFFKTMLLETYFFLPSE